MKFILNTCFAGILSITFVSQNAHALDGLKLTTGSDAVDSVVEPSVDVALKIAKNLAGSNVARMLATSRNLDDKYLKIGQEIAITEALVAKGAYGLDFARRHISFLKGEMESIGAQSRALKDGAEKLKVVGGDIKQSAKIFGAVVTAVNSTYEVQRAWKDALRVANGESIEDFQVKNAEAAAGILLGATGSLAPYMIPVVYVATQSRQLIEQGNALSDNYMDALSSIEYRLNGEGQKIAKLSLLGKSEEYIKNEILSSRKRDLETLSEFRGILTEWQAFLIPGNKNIVAIIDALRSDLVDYGVLDKKIFDVTRESLAYSARHAENSVEYDDLILGLNRSLAQVESVLVGSNSVGDNYKNQILSNYLTGITQGANSHFGSANIFSGWNNKALNAAPEQNQVLASTNNNNAQQLSGVQQTAQAINTTAFKASDWVVVGGDASKHYSFGNSFGPISAANNGPIAALNNADVQQTMMQKVVEIPTGVKQVTVGMMANFVTNEYPKYVGSKYNDSAIVEIRTGSGNTYQATLFNKELNSANFQAVGSLPAPLAATGGQTGFESISKIIPVANGGQLVITVKSINVGDTAYPSAILINSTNVK